MVLSACSRPAAMQHAAVPWCVRGLLSMCCEACAHGINELCLMLQRTHVCSKVHAGLASFIACYAVVITGENALCARFVAGQPDAVVPCN